MTAYERTLGIIVAPFLGALFCLFLPLIGFLLLAQVIKERVLER